MNMLKAEDIKEYKLFAGLNKSELAKIAKLCTTRRYEANAIVCEPNTRATELYILAGDSDSVKISIPIRDHKTKIVIHSLNKGETFGWAAIVPPHMRTAAATCTAATELICIDGRGLLDLLDKNEHMGYIFMKNLSGVISSRLAYTTVVLRLQVEKLSHQDSE